MEKKLTAQGPKDRKSFTLTLPIEWVKKENLDKKKNVNLEIVGNKVIISPNKIMEERVTINLKDYENSKIKILQGLYRAGIDEIKIYFSDNELLEDSLDIIEKNLIGYEVVEQKKDYIIVKDITKESEEDFKVIFRRIFLLLLQFSETKEAKQIKLLDRNIKKLINYCQRILMKVGHTEFKKIPLYYLILDRLEKINDEYKWLLSYHDMKTIKHFDEINNSLRNAYELFYKFEDKKFDKYTYKTYLIKNELKEGTLNKADIHIHNIARILNSLYGDIYILKFDETSR